MNVTEHLHQALVMDRQTLLFQRIYLIKYKWMNLKELNLIVVTKIKKTEKKFIFNESRLNIPLFIISRS